VHPIDAGQQIDLLHYELRFRPHTPQQIPTHAAGQISRQQADMRQICAAWQSRITLFDRQLQTGSSLLGG